MTCQFWEKLKKHVFEPHAPNIIETHITLFKFTFYMLMPEPSSQAVADVGNYDVIASGCYVSFAACFSIYIFHIYMFYMICPFLYMFYMF